MKKIFDVASTPSRDVVLLIVRLAIGALMLVHGEVSLALAVFSEVICSLLIMVGLGTRVATIPLIITMLVAVFYVHGNDPFIKQEMGLHYLLVYGLLFLGGSGKYSADYLIDRFYLHGQPATREQ